MTSESDPPRLSDAKSEASAGLRALVSSADVLRPTPERLAQVQAGVIAAASRGPWATLVSKLSGAGGLAVLAGLGAVGAAAYLWSAASAPDHAPPEPPPAVEMRTSLPDLRRIDPRAAARQAAPPIAQASGPAPAPAILAARGSVVSARALPVASDSQPRTRRAAAGPTNPSQEIVTPAPSAPTSEVAVPSPTSVAASQSQPGIPSATELALLASARHALHAHDYPRALSLLAAHARDFPTGILTEERQALRIEALWQSGDEQTARGLLSAFQAEHPSSAYRAHLREIVRE